jgi:DNA invertase Pin-like site-specific DNA recombinase
MRAAVYVRVSTQEQAREGISLAAQEEACRRMAVEAGALEEQARLRELVSESIQAGGGLPGEGRAPLPGGCPAAAGA